MPRNILIWLMMFPKLLTCRTFVWKISWDLHHWPRTFDLKLECSLPTWPRFKNLFWHSSLGFIILAWAYLVKFLITSIFHQWLQTFGWRPFKTLKGPFINKLKNWVHKLWITFIIILKCEVQFLDINKQQPRFFGWSFVYWIVIIVAPSLSMKAI